MAYSLYFWRDISRDDRPADALCERLCAEEDVDGLARLPVAEVKSRFLEAFPNIDDGLTELSWEGAGSYFQVTWPTGTKPGHTQAIFVECGYQLLQTAEVMNQIIDVANGLGCALYDPQTEQRYEQPD